MKNIIYLTITIVLLLGSCKEKDETMPPVALSEFAGNYLMAEGSYRTMLDSAGNEISTENQSLRGENVALTILGNDSVQLNSQTIGTVKGKASRLDDNQFSIKFARQSYNGSDFDPSGENFVEQNPNELFYLQQNEIGKRMKNGNLNIQKPAARSRIRFTTNFK